MEKWWAIALVFLKSIITLHDRWSAIVSFIKEWVRERERKGVFQNSGREISPWEKSERPNRETASRTKFDKWIPIAWAYFCNGFADYRTIELEKLFTFAKFWTYNQIQFSRRVTSKTKLNKCFFFISLTFIMSLAALAVKKSTLKKMRVFAGHLKQVRRVLSDTLTHFLARCFGVFLHQKIFSFYGIG